MTVKTLTTLGPPCQHISCTNSVGIIIGVLDARGAGIIENGDDNRYATGSSKFCFLSKLATKRRSSSGYLVGNASCRHIWLKHAHTVALLIANNKNYSSRLLPYVLFRLVSVYCDKHPPVALVFKSLDALRGSYATLNLYDECGDDTAEFGDRVSFVLKLLSVSFKSSVSTQQWCCSTSDE